MKKNYAKSVSIKPSNAKFFRNASPEIFKTGIDLRKKMTMGEKILWNELRGKKINGLRFRRQHPMNRFILDFYCHSKKLVIEIDGEIHNSYENQNRDENKDNYLKEIGLTVVRFRNEEVINNLGTVLAKIKELVN